MTDLVVHPQEAPLLGGVPVPADGGIVERALVLASSCEGASEIGGLSPEDDRVAAAAAAMGALGVRIEVVAKGRIRVEGRGLFGLSAPRGPIACGTSATLASLLAGVLAGQTFQTTLAGEAPIDAALVDALRRRGAVLDGAWPLSIGPLPEGKELTELEVASAAPDADTKSGVLLSGLYAHGATWFGEPALSPDHTERMLYALGVPIRVLGTMIEIDPAGWSGKMPAFEMDVPGDVGAAAFLLAAGTFVPGSRVTVRGVGANPTRAGIFEIARLMGAAIEIVPQGERAGEPVAEATASSAALRGIALGGELVARARADVAIACALAARASGTTTIRDAGALAGEARILRAFGVRCEEVAGGLVVEGRDGPLDAAHVDSGGDARLAMMAAILALVARGPSRVGDCDRIATLFPRFVGTLRALGARIDVVH